MTPAGGEDSEYGDIAGHSPNLMMLDDHAPIAEIELKAQLDFLSAYLFTYLECNHRDFLQLILLYPD